MKCKYHPLDLALNYCENCDANYCEACSDESAAKARSRADLADHKCFVCDRPMVALSGAQTVMPFWNRISEIYRYPLNAQAVSALLIVSLITAFVGSSWFLLMGTSIAIMMYSFSCLRETARGNLVAPGLEACLEGSIAPLFYVSVAVFVNALVVNKAFEYFGQGIGILALIFFVLTVPAMVIIIAVEEKLAPALNPSELFSVIRATGSSYIVMALFIMIMASSVLALVSFLGVESDSFLGVLFQSLIANYYGVVIFHIMGYLVYQNQDALGFSTKANVKKTSARPDADRIKSQLEVLIKAGEYDAAQQVARKQLRDQNATLWDWSRAFTLSCISKNTDQAKTMFNDYASKLESLGERDKLGAAYLELKKRQPKFQIEDHEQRLFVAQSLFETGRYTQVVNMLHMFHRETDDNGRVTRALKLLSESSASIPGHEKLANQYRTLYQMQVDKA